METAQKKCLGIFDEAEEKVIAAGIIFMVLMETVNTIFKFVHPSRGYRKSWRTSHIPGLRFYAQAFAPSAARTSL